MAGGEVLGFEESARQLVPGLMRRAMVLTRDKAAAEDLVQETLTRLFVRWSRIDPAGNVQAYALQTLYRLFLRSRRPWESARAVVPEGPTGERIADAVALRRSLGDALAVLKPIERAVVVLRYVDDRPVEEVARLLGRRAGSVRVTAHRALAKLRAVRALDPAREVEIDHA